MKPQKGKLFPEIESIIKTLDLSGISDERKEILQPLVDYIQGKVQNTQPVRLNFICTHNSRRSHLSQIWAQTIGTYLGMQDLDCYSGGTEATALFPMVAETLIKQGFDVGKLSENQNPVYSIKYSENGHPVIGFSKTYDDPFNPKSGYAAILVCNNADKGCPHVSGAEKRIPITFEDPKAFDGTPQQAEKYLERSLQIATEIYYLFSKVNLNDFK